MPILQLEVRCRYFFPIFSLKLECFHTVRNIPEEMKPLFSPISLFFYYCQSFCSIFKQFSTLKVISSRQINCLKRNHFCQSPCRVSRKPYLCDSVLTLTVENINVCGERESFPGFNGKYIFSS